MTKGKNILWFAEVGKKDLELVGGKGANLGELLKAQISIPMGFIVSSKAYFDFVAKTKIDKLIKNKLSNINPEDTKTINKVANEIQKTILHAQLDKKLQTEIIDAYHELACKTNEKFVAVRSSATAEDLPGASFAGQQKTFLNVTGDKKIIAAVRNCWASLFEARAIYYRQVNKFDHLKVGIAVPIQVMVQSEVSGILFTIDPVTNNKNQIAIDAGYGLGEAIVSGSVNPDRYLVDKDKLEIVTKDISHQTWKIARVGNEENAITKHVAIAKEEQDKQKLADEKIVELATMGKKIEEYYKSPQDTEWALFQDKIYFVQSRPVTTYKKDIKVTEIDGKNLEKENNDNQPTDDDVIVRGVAASIGMMSGPVNIIHSPSEIDQIQKGDVLVTEMTTPDYVPAMKRASAIVTDTGGRTCHASIVSRELGIPCVVGCGTATSHLKQGQMVTVDGAKGVVYKGKFKESEPMKVATTTRGQIMVRQEVPITGTKVYVNLAEVEKAAEIAELPVDGVGLLRAEFMIAALGKHPKLFVKEKKEKEFITKLADNLQIFVSNFSPRPVIYRATDFKTNEYKNLEGGAEFEPKEENPMIGYRGCRRYLNDPEEFAMELEAIKIVRNSRGFRNLHLMIPFVRTVNEFKQVKELIAKSGLLDSQDFKLYMMAEVPSNVLLIDKFLDLGISGVSIGSNDLTQLTLGVDRDSGQLSEWYDERDEAVLMSISHIIHKCRARGVSVSICGQAPSVYPEYTEFLVEAGITSISVNPDMIITARQLIASVEKKIILKKILDR